jgi:hypothetical protein
VLVAANVDKDSRVLQYQGTHGVVYSDPIVIAVLASAPYYGGAKQEAGVTVLGDSITGGFDASHAVGFTTGFSVGAHYETPLWGSAGSVEGKVTFSFTADFLWGGGTELTYSSAIENPSGQDLVVFTAVPYDAYVYKVLVSPDDDEGKTVTLNFPREPKVYHHEREYYNEHNGAAPDIGPPLLGHTVGIPESYPTSDEMLALVEDTSFLLKSNKPATCGHGTESRGVEWSESNHLGFGVGVEMHTEVESITGCLLLGLSGGYHFGVELVWHWSESIFIEGSVGGVQPKHWEPSMAFSWGLFAYKAELAGQANPVTLVSYWVEPAF